MAGTRLVRMRSGKPPSPSKLINPNPRYTTPGGPSAPPNTNGITPAPQPPAGRNGARRLLKTPAMKPLAGRPRGKVPAKRPARKGR